MGSIQLEWMTGHPELKSTIPSIDISLYPGCLVAQSHMILYDDTFYDSGSQPS